MTALNIILLIVGALVIYSIGWWLGFKYGTNSAVIVMLELEEKMRAIPPDVLDEIQRQQVLTTPVPTLKRMVTSRGKSAWDELHEDPTYQALMEAQKRSGNGSH